MSFRLIEYYKGITGPSFVTLNVDDERAESERKIMETATKYFPQLSKAL